MKQIGILLLILGAGSFVLDEMNLEFKLLALVDQAAGPENAIWVRIGVAALGALLLIIGFATGGKKESES